MNTGDRMLAGRYRLGEEIGRGELTAVYRGADVTQGERQAAVKILSDAYSNSPAFVERFLELAKANEALHGPHIVDTYDSGRDENGIVYVVCEWYGAPTLRERLSHWGRPLEPVEAARLCLQIIEGLDSAHHLGIMHGGLKPENVLIGSTGRVQVSDFGLLRAMEVLEDAGTRVTLANNNPYFAPEQMRGEMPDARADVFALGMMLVEMVGGRPARDAFAAWRLAHVQGAAERPVPRHYAPELPAVIESVMIRALRFNPNERYATAAEMGRDLENFVASHAAEPAEPARPPAPPARHVPLPPPAPQPGQTSGAPGGVRPARRAFSWGGCVYPLIALSLLAVLCLLFAATLQWLDPFNQRTVNVPQLIGLKLDDANRVAGQSGFQLVVSEQRVDPDQPDNTVVAQAPQAGTESHRGQTILVAIVLRPTVPPQREVPPVVGQNEFAARQAIANAGLRLGTINLRADAAPYGTVLEQTPQSGLSVLPDTPVDLVISSGPEPTATATQPTSGCLGDERLSFNPPIPVLNQPVLIDAYSSRPHAGVALTGPGNPEFKGVYIEGNFYHWQWQAVPSAPGHYDFALSVNNGQVCARNAFDIAFVPTATATFTPPAPVATWTPTLPAATPPTPTPTSGTPLPAGYAGGWGSAGSDSGQFRVPVGIAVQGNLVFVADVNNNRIQIFDPNGTLVSTWGTDLSQPQDIAARPDGTFVIADTNDHRIEIRDFQGNLIQQWGGSGIGPGQFRWPHGVVVDASGRIFVADTYNNRIQRFDVNGNFQLEFGSLGPGTRQFNHPSGVAIDTAGMLYIADTYNHRVEKYTPDGFYLGNWGGYGSANGQFNAPSDIAVDAAGNVYVADSGNNRVQKFDPNGSFLASWGTRGSDPGQLAGPQGIAVAPDGTIYVADTGNNRVEKFR
jgi:serine/threonine protein kinase/sugar lactone lactonase YvrE